MNVIVGMECSRIIADSFEREGHTAISVDLKPNSNPHHIQGDIFELFARLNDAFAFELGIFHPICTYLCGSGLHWNKRRPERATETQNAAEAFMRIWRLPVPAKCLENPIGTMSTLFRKPDQIIQPWMFGDDASKATCLWLDNLPPLFPTRRVYGRMVNGRERWANQTDSGQNKLGPSPTRAAERAETYPGIAAAMTTQWGQYGSRRNPRMAQESTAQTTIVGSRPTQ